MCKLFTVFYKIQHLGEFLQSTEWLCEHAYYCHYHKSLGVFTRTNYTLKTLKYTLMDCMTAFNIAYIKHLKIDPFATQLFIIFFQIKLDHLFWLFETLISDIIL